MPGEIIVPPLGESVTEATVAKWHKSPGEQVNLNDLLVELETDKVTLEVNALVAGALKEVKVNQGGTVSVGDLLGIIDASAKGAKPEPANANASSAANASANQPKPAAPLKVVSEQKPASKNENLSPAVRKMVAENNVNPNDVQGTGKDGRLTKGDVIESLQTNHRIIESSNHEPSPSYAKASEGREERVKMSRLRQRIAERLKQSQQTAAILTTFNEVDMGNIMQLRNEYKESFEKKHGVKLGFMSFFVKAAINALQEIPAVNGEIDGDEIIYKNYYDIGVAVGTEQGLVVPVLRNADKLSFAEIEKTIGDYGKKARDGKLSMNDLTGGTFTISNGGVYGSLMSTPIINPPQSAILGMHKTQERPMAINGKIEIRPMMYLALSYDHRLIDGKEAVTFLVRVKEAIEDPRRLLLSL